MPPTDFQRSEQIYLEIACVLIRDEVGMLYCFKANTCKH